jgi:hypothetical protein
MIRSIPVRFLRLLSCALLAGCASAALAQSNPPANDFPTQARVEFVLECMQKGRAPMQEMLYKCSCTIDRIAEEVKYDRWVDLYTVANATSIAGERGAPIRDIPDGRKQINAYRDLQARARKACFIND